MSMVLTVYFSLNNLAHRSNTISLAKDAFTFSQVKSRGKTQTLIYEKDRINKNLQMLDENSSNIRGRLN